MGLAPSSSHGVQGNLCVLKVYDALLRDEMAQQVTDNAVEKRVPLARYIKAEVQSRLKPVGGKVRPTQARRPIIAPLAEDFVCEIAARPCLTAGAGQLIPLIYKG